MVVKKGLYLNGVISGIKTKEEGKTDALFEFLDKMEDNELSYGGTSFTKFVDDGATLQLEGNIFNIGDDDFVMEDLKKVLEDNKYKYEGQLIPVESIWEEDSEKEN